MSHSHTRAIADLDPRDVQALLDAGRILLIDVREPMEYAAERIHGALLYPLSTFDAAALPPDDPREVVFHCGSGKRSHSAAQKRLTAGAAQARHMAGGIGAWRAAGLPTIRIDPASGAIVDAGRG